MSNIKKIIGVVLALVMALSVATVAFAATGDKYSVSIEADKTTLTAGETATVTVKVTSNYNVSTMSIPVFFDKTLVTVSDASTTLTGDLKDIKVVTEGDLSKFYSGTTYTEADHGVVALTYVAKEGASIETYNNTAVMTFKVTALADVTGNAVVECVQGTVKTSTNTNGKLYVGKNSSGNATVDSLAEWIDDADIKAATATIAIGGGATADPELVLTATGEGYGTVIRNDICTTNYNGCVFGIDTLNGEAIEDYVTATNGSIEVLPNEESGAYTTGATILLKNGAGDVVATYVFIYFGDVNGDGLVDGTDSVAVEMHDGWIELFEDDSPYFYAADVNHDGLVDGTDSVAIEMHDGWLEMLEDQNVIAAGFNSAW